VADRRAAGSGPNGERGSRPGRVRPHPALRRGRTRVRTHASAAANHVVRFLRTEQIGGLILLGATALALIVANSPLKDWYHRLGQTTVGPEALHANLTLAQWATDGLLTFFFVVVGLELQHELVVGELRDPRRAILPIFAAIGGMVVPAAVTYAVGSGGVGIGKAWAVPVATDIAFALAVLALAARELPPTLRVFLLTLAIVDDLGAILLIAILFTAHFALAPLLGSIAAIAAYALLQRARFRGWWLYLPLALFAWALLHASGIHATLAGVAIGLTTRVKPDPGEHESPAGRLEHLLQPISAGVCVPAFAFMAAGVSLSLGALRDFATDRVALAVVAGLVVGKPVGVLLGCGIATKSGLARLPDRLYWRDLVAVSVLTGCGFTVSLLIAELAFGDTAVAQRVKVAVLAGSLIASVVAALMLRRRARAHAT
jgi:NhaA family Na+:H+ antiporter